MTSQADIDRVLGLINKLDIDGLKADEFTQFQYQGFDPIKLLHALIKLKASKSIDDKVFGEDLLKMVAIGLIKGNVNEHNITKMSDKGKDELKALISKYSIKMGGGQNQPSETLTFPRIMATFPHLAVRMTGVLGGKEYRGGPFLSYNLPDPMKVQVFPSVIPRDLEESIKRFFLTAALAYSIDQTIQISRIDKPDLVSIAASQANFIQIGHNSPVPTDVIRKETFNLLGFPNKYDFIRIVVEKYKDLVDKSIVVPTEKEYKQALAVI